VGNGSLPFEPRRKVDPENRLGPFIARSEPRTTKRLSSFEQGFISAADAPLSAITVASHAHPVPYRLDDLETCGSCFLYDTEQGQRRHNNNGARMVNETRNSAEEEPRSVEKSTNARRKTLDSRTSVVRTAKGRPQASQRAAEKTRQSFAVSVSEKLVHPPAFQQPRANKPLYSSRATPENNSVGKQLNVTWEN